MRWIQLAVGVGILGTHSKYAWAGDHRPVCEKVAVADRVFEMRFQIMGSYPEDARAREWAPPQPILDRISQTGEVIAVFKGPVEVGGSWVDGYPVPFSPGHTASAWDLFFTRGSFTLILFLTESEEGVWKSTGYAEESAGCSASAHQSWCPDYERLKDEIATCLSVQ